MAPHSSTLAWKIPRTEEPGGLQSMGSLRVGHDWATSLSLFTFMHWRRKWQPTPVFLPGESQGWGSLVGSHRVGHDWSDLAAAAATCRYVTRSWIYPSLVCKLFMFYWGIQDRYKPALRDVVKRWGTSGFIWEDWRHISPQRIHSWIHK